jgi:hypothetical protein
MKFNENLLYIFDLTSESDQMNFQCTSGRILGIWGRRRLSGWLQQSSGELQLLAG